MNEVRKVWAEPNLPTPFPELIPLQESHALRLFPVECLPKTIREYVKAVATHSQTAVDMAATVALGVLAVCLQGKYVIEVNKGYCEPLSLFTVIIAPPGERKSSVLREMTHVLYAFEQEYNDALRPEIQKYQTKKERLERRLEGLKERLKRSTDDRIEKEIERAESQLQELPEVSTKRFFADDCSSEALTSLMARNDGVISVLSSEGGVFDILAGRYSSKTNMDVWLKGHCGDAIRVDRMGREAEYIKRPTLSCILSIQPSILEDVMTNNAMTGRGLMARFLYTFPKSQIGKRTFYAPEIPVDISQVYEQLIRTLMALPMPSEPAVISLSVDACHMISDHFDRHERFLMEEGRGIGDWASKYIGTVMRIAGLLHIAGGGGKEVDATCMRNAICIGQYFLEHAAYAYSMMGTDLSLQKAIYVAAKLKKEHVREIKRSELFRMCRGKFFNKAEDILSTIDLLEGHGYLLQLEPETKSTPGRKPDVRVLVNPAIYNQN